MKVPSWLSTCSSTASIATYTAASPENIHSTAASTMSSCSDIQTQSSSSSMAFSSASDCSVQTSLSLSTLPSVPSLQKLSLFGDNAAGHPSSTAHFITSIKPLQAHVNFLAVHDKLLYAASGNEINVYEIESNALLDTLKFVNSSSGSVKSIVFCDRKIFTSHQDSKIRIFKLDDLQKKHKLVATLPTLKDRLTRSIFPRNYVKVRRHKKRLWINHQDTVSGLAAQDGKMVLSISWDKSFKLWEAQNLRCLDSVNPAHDDAINAVVISKDGLVYTGSADKRIKVWKKDGKNYRLVATLEKHKSAVNALALDLDESILFSGSCDRSILVWEREDTANHMAVTGALRGHAKAILCLMNVHDVLFSGSADRTVRIWQRGIDGGYWCLRVLDGHQTAVRSLAAEDAAHGGVTVFSGSFDGEIRVWQVEVPSMLRGGGHSYSGLMTNYTNY